MIPVLYSSDERAFLTNGIGKLSDSTKCLCTEVLNGSYELELELPISSRYFSEMLVNDIIMAKPNYEDDPQPFRIYEIEDSLDGMKSVKAAHISYDTNGIPILPFHAEDLAHVEAFMKDNRVLSKDSEFNFITRYDVEGVMDVQDPTSFRSLLAGSDTSIASIYNGEYHYDRFDIELLNQRGTDKGICFRYQTNIKGFEQTFNSEGMYSAAYGYWKKSEKNTNKFVYGSIIEIQDSLPYEKILILDVSDKFEKKPTADQIDDYVEQYVHENNLGITKYDIRIDYADDENIVEVCLGDFVGIVLPEYGVKAKARCNKVVFDVLQERNESIELGEADSGLAGELTRAENRSNSAIAKVKNSSKLPSLWTGSWSSGEITVPGLNEYTTFLVSADGTDTVVRAVLNNGHFHGHGANVTSSNRYDYYLAADVVSGSEETLSLVKFYSVNSSGTVTNRTVSEIMGVI